MLPAAVAHLTTTTPSWRRPHSTSTTQEPELYGPAPRTDRSQPPGGPTAHAPESQRPRGREGPAVGCSEGRCMKAPVRLGP